MSHQDFSSEALKGVHQVRFALIPAAGKSVRMGRAKLNLMLGDRTVLERVVDALREAGVRDIFVVTRPAADDLNTLAKRAGTHVIPLPDDTPDMRSTVMQGLGGVERALQPAQDDLWLLIPADHPTLDADVIRKLTRAPSQHPRASIFHPTYAGKRGHPTLLRWLHVKGMRELEEGEGLNRYFRQQGEATCEVPVSTPEILADLDTPEDLQKIQQRLALL